ncbi:MAG: radical SAM protein [Candidatus Gracilibacteria bacterium]|nr:radical SAM protein [Candidatus Gracilibacteria bacterium]
MKFNNIECINCKYKDWDCKNCFLNIKKGDNINLTLFFIMTRQCNYRCNYCAIDFSDNALSYQTIDDYIKFIQINRDKINELRIEFFGGEPLLEFEKIKYIVKKTKILNISRYSIVTNGELLSPDKIIFFNNNNFDIIFSVALHSLGILSRKELFNNNLKNFLINFIIEPGKESYMYEIFKKLIKIGFRKFSLIAIRYTKKRAIENLKNLDILLNKIKKINDGLKGHNINLGLFTGKNNDDIDNGIGKNDFEIVFDYDGNMYADYEVELYILRDLVSKNIFNLDDIFLGNINTDKNIDIYNLLKIRNIIKPHFYLNNIGNYLNIQENDIALGKVMSKYNINK